MPKVNTFNYDTIASWNGSEDLFVVEQPDGTKVATPAMVKQFIEAGDFVATGEVKDGHGNILADMAKSVDVKGLAEAGDFEAAGEVKDGHGNILADMADVLNDMAEVKTISGSGSYSCSYAAYKYGKVVYLFVTGVANASTGQVMELFTLPVGWRPRKRARAYGSTAMGSMGISAAIGFNVDTDGKVATYSYSAFSSGGFTVTYISE